jgi:hypothetical protein
MARRPFDPLDCIPSPDVLREQLRETLTLADRLRILLDLSERLHLPLTTGNEVAPPSAPAVKVGA